MCVCANDDNYLLLRVIKMDSAKEELQKNKVLIDDLQKAVEDSEKNTRTLNDTITNLVCLRAYRFVMFI